MDILLNMLEFLSSMLLIGQVFGTYVKKLYIKRKIMNDQHDIVFKLKQQYEGLSSNEFRELIHGNPYSKYFSPSTPTKLEGFGDGEYYAWNVSKIEVILACRLTLPMPKGRGFLARRSPPRYFAVARKVQRSYTISPSVWVGSGVSHRTL